MTSDTPLPDDVTKDELHSLALAAASRLAPHAYPDAQTIAALVLQKMDLDRYWPSNRNGARNYVNTAARIIHAKPPKQRFVSDGEQEAYLLAINVMDEVPTNYDIATIRDPTLFRIDVPPRVALLPEFLEFISALGDLFRAHGGIALQVARDDDIRITLAEDSLV